MHRRALLPMLLLPLLAAAAPEARADSATELPWTRVAGDALDRYMAAFGEVRISNLVVEREAGSDPLGPATEFEISASVANRNREWRRVRVQVVGVQADGTPTLSAQGDVDVDGRRNETLRAGFVAPEDALSRTVAYFVRAVSVARD